ncbi:hypothetical protein [Streptomyces sp. NBC_00344]|uniref:hypothetical protein n=1 Tax=Streptomyces sp. NBC_00344 TaxID=2975720 RepID=UPI002E1A0B77
MSRLLMSCADFIAGRTGSRAAPAGPDATACVSHLPYASERHLVVPVRLVVLVIVLACFVAGFAALLRDGYTPTDTVSVLSLASVAALEAVRRANVLVRRR